MVVVCATATTTRPEMTNNQPMIKLTHELIHAGESDNGGWGRQQIILIGAGWPPVKGWLRHSIGHEIPEQDYNEFLRLRNQHLLRKKHRLTVSQPTLF